jgi:argininosuccinate lyase
MPGGTRQTDNPSDTLWSLNRSGSHDIEIFTSGDDHILDRYLIEYDCIASIAHVRMLNRIGVLKKNESKKLIRELNIIRKLGREGKFAVTPEQEDVHTAIEQHLTRKLGDLGKQIHTGRSRNDQILTALRLYYKDHLGQLGVRLRELRASMMKFKKSYGRITFPGYTHTRKAMPSTFGMWSGAYYDSLSDDLVLLKTVMRIIDQSPLGTGAGYGIPMKLDRGYTARLLGFSRIQKNPVYVQHSRGKFEMLLLHLLSHIMYDLNRCAADIIFYSIPELGYLQLPEFFTTGSSIMPQKQNPDVLELIRARYHTVAAGQFQVGTTAANLISGYHRDIQETKEPVMKSIAITKASVYMMSRVFQYLSVDRNACTAALTDELFATERVYTLVAQGVPFRDAYRRIAARYRETSHT